MGAKRGLGQRFARIWTAATVSLLGDGVALVGFPLLATELTDNAVLIAGTQVARGLPWLVSGLAGGVAADRFDRRRVMVIVDILRMVTVGVLAVAVSTGHATIALVYVVAFALGVGETFFDPAAVAIVPDVVRIEDLDRANGRLYASESSAKELIGPAIGGAMFAAAAWMPFFVDAVSFGVAAAIVVGVSGSFRPRATDPSAGHEPIRLAIGEGWHYLRSNPILRTLAIMGGLANLAAGAVEGTLVLFALQALGVRDWGYGLLLAAAAVGGTLGALGADRVIGRFGPGTVVVAGWGLAGIAMSIAAAASNAVVVGVLFAVVFAGTACANIIGLTLRQELVPEELRGRVAAFYRTLLWSAYPLGALIGGLLAQHFNVRAPFVLYAIVTLIVAAIGAMAANNRRIAAARAAGPARDAGT